jgi:hypothetical protein
VGPGRHEDRVEKVVVSIERRLPGVEIERDAVLAGLQRLLRDDDMAVDLPDGRLDAVGLDASQDPGAIGLVVEDDRRGGRQRETDERAPATGCDRTAGIVNAKS